MKLFIFILMQEIKSRSYYFQIMEEKDIEECVELIGKIYAQFNVFRYYLEYKPCELKESAKVCFQKILPDKLTVVAKDSNDKVIGCYVGMKLTYMNSLKCNSFKKTENLNFKVNLENMLLEEKNKILEELDYIFLKDYYEYLIANKELDYAVLGKYFCISEEYFGTPLAKDLTINYSKNLIDRGVKHCYGIVFNLKVFTLLSKYFPVKILKKDKFTFDKETEKIELEAFLFYCAPEIEKLFFSKF